MFKILIGVIVVAIGVITTMLILDPNVGVQSTAPVTEVANTFTVSIEGEVYKTGTYTMDEGALMSDLFEKCGGTTNNADERAYYDNAVLTSGVTYYIPSRFDANDLCNVSEVDKVNVNIDNATTLAKINGITSTIANAIVTYRNENGLFSTLEQLLEVKGIGNATYHKIRDYVILHA